MKNKWLVWGGLAIATLLPELFMKYVRYEGSDGFGFYAWFGLGTCFLLVFAALLVGRVVKCRDDYYDD